MPTVTVGDRQLSYESSGNGENRLLFVHGFRNSCQSWSLIGDRLDPTRFSSWYLDLPGCGRSSRPARWQECTIERYADDVQRFCSSLGLRDVVLIGHSLGGAVAMRVALDHPEVLRGLVLVAPTAAEGIAYLTDDQLATLIRPSDEELAAVVRAAFHQVPSEETFERVMATVRSASPAHVEGAVRSQREFSVTDRLGEISIPTLVVGGDRDRHVPIRYTLRTAAAIRRCAVQIYHNVGHAPFIEVPEEFTELLEEFVLDDLTG